MAFQFKRKESVAKGVSRLSRERLERALEHLQAGAQVEAIHRVRKDIKKLRAILRLMRGEIGVRVYRQGINALREAANHLAGARDANVRLQALAKLTAHFQPDLAAQSFRQVKTALHRSSRAETERFLQSQSSGAVRRILRQLGPVLEKLDVPTKGWRAVGPGVQASYARGRQALERVVFEPTAENFHEWRKRAKDLWYQVRLLRPIWPEQMCALVGELARLTELLGEDHDLLMLEQAVVGSNCQTNGALHEMEVLNGLIALRQRQLRSAALALGERIYVEKPGAFCRRLGRYWQLWCEEAEPGGDRAGAGQVRSVCPPRLRAASERGGGLERLARPTTGGKAAR